MGDKAMLINTSRCVACRGCQVACKQWNDNPAQRTSFFGGPGYQNPADLSFVTFTLIRFLTAGAYWQDLDSDKNWHFQKWGCMHCINPNCVSACASTGVGAAKVDPATGFVYVDQSICIGCKSCATSSSFPPGCPFRVPRYDVPYGGQIASHCHGCWERVAGTYPATAAGNPGSDPIGANSLLTDVTGAPIGASLLPACVTACPNEALRFGDRTDVIAEANNIVATVGPSGRNEFPEANAYGDSSWGSPYDTRVIYVLTKPPSFYGLP